MWLTAASANGLYSADGRLYLPWVEVDGVLYGVELETRPGGFAVAEAWPRGGVAEEALATVARLEGGVVRLPRVQFDGRFYEATLRFTSGGELTLEDVAPAAEPAGRGEVLEVTVVGEVSLATIQGMLPFWLSAVTPLYDVELLRLVYRTVDPFGSETVASALLALPRGASGALPLAAYQHGTLLRRDGAPSGGELDDGYLVSTLLASMGFVAVAPDYLGLGASEGLHPFVHAATAASAVVDALRAARDEAGARGFMLDGKLFLGGYSEGGYVTLAAQRALERDHAEEFTLTASAPMAGPYDLSGTMREMVLAGTPHESPYYFPYLLLAYDRVYGLYDVDEEMFGGELAAILRPLYDGTHDGDEINALLPVAPADALAPELFTALRDEPNDPLNLALAENDLLHWTPASPTRLYHCDGDPVVPFANAQAAYDAFIARGAEQVELVTVPGDDHADCALFTLLGAAVWFTSLM